MFKSKQKKRSLGIENVVSELQIYTYFYISAYWVLCVNQMAVTIFRAICDNNYIAL